MRVQEQAKAQAAVNQPTSECQIPITRKEFKSFTRKSIMVLNSTPERPSSAYRISVAGEMMPRNVFNHPSRDSVLVAEIRLPSSGFTNDDPFHDFSRQLAQEGFWDRASRKSKALSVVNFSPMVSRLSRLKPNPLPMMELLNEEPEHQSPSDTSSSRRPRSRYNPGDLRVQNQNDTLRLLPPMPKLAAETIQLHLKGPGPAPSSFTSNESPDPISNEKLSSFQDKSFAQSAVSFPSPVRQNSRKRSTSPELLAKSVRVEKPSPPLIGLAQSQSEKLGIDLPDSLLAIISPLDDLARAPSPCAIEALPPICPDDAVAHYASTRAATPSPVPSSTKLARSGSVLSFMRRSLNGNRPSSAGRESPASALSLSISEPRIDYEERSTRRDRSPISPKTPLASKPPPLTLGEFCHKPLGFTTSIIIEEDEDCGASMTNGRVPMTPMGSYFNETTTSRCSDGPSPTRLPPTALNGLGGGLRRMRSHTIASMGLQSESETTSSDATTSTFEDSSRCSVTRSSSSGSIATICAGGRMYSSRNSALVPRLTLKKKPSLSTNPNGRRRRHADQALSSRDRDDSTSSSFGSVRSGYSHTSALNRICEAQSLRNPQHSNLPPLNRDQAGPANVRRTASAQARIPLSGTMSSGGVRDSSFVP